MNVTLTSGEARNACEVVRFYRVRNPVPER